MKTHHIVSVALVVGMLIAGVSVMAKDGASADLKALHASESPRVSRTPKPSPSPVNVACMASAVSAREASLSTAVGTFTSATKTAYSTRATALSAAYGKTSVTDIRAGVKDAWSKFNTSIKSAGKDWRTAQKSAWDIFRTATIACTGSASSADSENASHELSGN